MKELRDCYIVLLTQDTRRTGIEETENICKNDSDHKFQQPTIS